MKQLFLVAFGGALGSVARYSLNSLFYNIIGRSFPWSTFFVNIVGSFFIGFLSVIVWKKISIAEDLQAFLIIGFLGALTTFSGFSYENIQLIQQQQPSLAFINIIISVVFCLVACYIGLQLATKIF
jgi:fluoride exporter